jgi:hypothetical protein
VSMSTGASKPCMKSQKLNRLQKWKAINASCAKCGFAIRTTHNSGYSETSISMQEIRWSWLLEKIDLVWKQSLNLLVVLVNLTLGQWLAPSLLSTWS